MSYELPTEKIKQALYCFDQYQTYDLVWAQYIDQNILTLIFNAIPYNFILNTYRALYVKPILVERFTPDKLPWCKDWSTNLYEFLKLLSRTRLCANQLLNGGSLNIANPNQINYPQQLTGLQFPQQITINLPPGETLILSWLQYSFDNLRVGWIYDDYNHPCLIINKNHRKFYNSKDTTISINFDVSRILLNSLYLCQGSSQWLTGDNLNLLWYENQANILGEIINQLGLPASIKILKSLDVVCKWEERHHYFLEGQDSFAQLKKLYFNDTIFGNPQYEDLPDWAYWATLIYANNDHWKDYTSQEILESELIDRGKAIVLDIFSNSRGKVFINFNIWSFKNSMSFPDYLIDSPTYPYTFPFSFKYHTAPYYEGAFNAVNFVDFNNKASGIQRNYVNDNYLETNNSFWGTANNISARKERLGYAIQQNWTVDGLWLQYGTTSNTLNFIPGFYPYFELVESVKGYKINPRMSFFKEPISQVEKYFKELTVIEETILFESANNNTINYTLASQVIENTATELTVPHQSFEEKIVTITLQYHEFPLLNNSTINNNELKLIVDSLMEEIGEDDPNVTTDSIRIKEIHQALEAGSYAWDVDDPTAPRWWSLGKQIEAIANILGLQFNPDGTIKSVRQSKFIKQGATIPAGWSIGQWGKNEGGSTEGQPGGSPTETRYGLAYPVRSGRFDSDPFTGSPQNIDRGGYVLVECLPQLLAVLMDDLDRALGLQDAGAMVIPSSDGTNYAFFQGLTSFLAELLYMNSELSKLQGQCLVSSLKNQGMIQELLKQQGVPTALKMIEMEMGDKQVKIPYPGINNNSPSNFDLICWVVSHLSILLGSVLGDDYHEPNNSNQ